MKGENVTSYIKGAFRVSKPTALKLRSDYKLLNSFIIIIIMKEHENYQKNHSAEPHRKYKKHFRQSQQLRINTPICNCAARYVRHAKKVRGAVSSNGLL